MRHNSAMIDEGGITVRVSGESGTQINMKQFLGRIGKDIKTYGVIVGVLFVLWLVFTLCFGSACVTVLVTGFPCPGCGMGHALLSLLMGNFKQAHLYNPAVWIWLLFAVSFFLYRYVFGKEMKHWGWILTVIALLTVAIYLYRMVNLFPTEPPLTYHEENLLQRSFPAYGEGIRNLFD